MPHINISRLIVLAIGWATPVVLLTYFINARMVFKNNSRPGAIAVNGRLLQMMPLRINALVVHLKKQLQYKGWFRLFVIMLVAVSIVLVVQRITIGIDLSDEAYYAIFIDDWLKGGVQTSTFRMLHQTAASIVYPLAWLYEKVTGSEDGLFLFLRTLFVVSNAMSALAWQCFIRRIAPSELAWVGACIVFVMIPFGLPAPSYNTLGQQGLITALACFGCATLNAPSERNRHFWAFNSAIAWSVATVAYPTLIIPLVMLFASIFIFRLPLSTKFIMRYAALVLIMQIIAWSLIISFLSVNTLVESFIFTMNSNDVRGFERKLTASFSILADNKRFVVIIVTSTCLSFLFRKRSPVLRSALIGAFALILIFLPPAFFGRSHDVVLLLALAGLPLLLDLRETSPLQDRLIAVLFTVSFLAGLITAASATNALYNFCIGAAPAAYLTLVTLNWRDGTARWTALGAQLAVFAAVASYSATFRYGELPNVTEPRQWINWGIFGAVMAQPDQLAILDLMRDHVAPLAEPERTIAVVGRIPGLMLATPARALMLCAFPVSTLIQPKAVTLTEQFYADAYHRPKIVVIYRDVYFEPINPFGARFDEWYAHLEDVSIGGGILQIFRLKS